MAIDSLKGLLLLILLGYDIKRIIKKRKEKKRKEKTNEGYETKLYLILTNKTNRIRVNTILQIIKKYFILLIFILLLIFIFFIRKSLDIRDI